MKGTHEEHKAYIRITGVSTRWTQSASKISLLLAGFFCDLQAILFALVYGKNWYLRRTKILFHGRKGITPGPGGLRFCFPHPRIFAKIHGLNRSRGGKS